MSSAELAEATPATEPHSIASSATQSATQSATMAPMTESGAMDTTVASVVNPPTVFVSIAGRVEHISVPQATLSALSKELEDRFGMDRQSGELRITSDAEGEHRVLTDEQFSQHLQAKNTLHAQVGEKVLADVEQRVWQLRQFQSNCFKDGLARLRQADSDMLQELAQLRLQLEQQAQRQAELTSELLQERHRREAADQATKDRHDELATELRRDLLREQHSRKASEVESTLSREADKAELCQSLDEKHQSALCFVAQLEGQTAELRSQVEVQSKRCAESIQEHSETIHKQCEQLRIDNQNDVETINKQCEQLRIDIQNDVELLRGSGENQKENIECEVSKREELEETIAEKFLEFLEKLQGMGSSCERIRVNADRSAIRLVPVEEAASRMQLAVAELQAINRPSLMSMRCAGQDVVTSVPTGSTLLGPVRQASGNDETTIDSRSSSLNPTPLQICGPSVMGPLVIPDVNSGVACMSPHSLSGSASASLSSPAKLGNVVAGRMPPAVSHRQSLGGVRPPLARVASAPGLAQNGIMQVADSTSRGTPRGGSPSRAAAAAAAAAVLLPDGAPARGQPTCLLLTPPTTMTNIIPPAVPVGKLSPVSLGSLASPRRHLGASPGPLCAALPAQTQQRRDGDSPMSLPGNCGQQIIRSQTPTRLAQPAHSGVMHQFPGVVPGRLVAAVTLGAPPAVGMAASLSTRPGNNISF